MLVLFLASTAWSADSRPNILFLFADDLAYDAVGFMGNEVVRTPNLDRLAGQGTVFSHAYNMGSWSGAVCVASRTMLNTGRFLWRAEHVYDSSETERAAGRWWSEHLKRAGYRTYFTGKWHVKADAEKAFDVARHVRPGMPNQTEAGYNRPLPGRPDPWQAWDRSRGGFWQGGTHWSVITAQDAIDFLQDARDREEPFFMYVAFNAPHDPRQSPREYVERYPADKIPVPENFLRAYPHHRAMGCGPELRDERLAPFPRTRHAVQVHRQEYYAIIEHLDAQIGRVIEALQASGKADQTWVFFTADHGLAVGQHGLMGKQNLYDHSLRVPFLVRAPGVRAGRRIDAPIHLQDILPTTLELASVPKPDHVEFHSLLPLLNGATRRGPYSEIYAAYLELQRAIIAGGYKLIVYPKANAIRLYDLNADPLEQHDLAGDPNQRPRIHRLFERLQGLQKSHDDTTRLQLPD